MIQYNEGFVDILLINANLATISQYASSSPPLGLAYIGAVLIENGFTVSVIDLNQIALGDDDFKQQISEIQPAIIGIYATTPSYNNSVKLANMAKAIDPGIKVVIGGPHVSVLSEEAIIEENIDIVVVGEGEYAMLAIANTFLKKQGKLDDIKGIVFNHNDAIIKTPKRSLITNPDGIPFPARALFNKYNYTKPYTIIASRGGCPYACHFCITNKIWGSKRIFRKPELIIREILSTVGQEKSDGAKHTVHFYDDTFTLNRGHSLQLCQMMEQHKLHELVDWTCMTRVDCIDNELINAMSKAGCCQIQYGVEAGSQKILNSIGKGTTLEEIEKAVQNTLRAGIKTVCFFMFPFPEDTEQTVREQIDYMLKLFEMGAIISLAITTPDPGTYFYENSDKLGLKMLSSNWDDYDSTKIILTTKHLSKEKLQSLFGEICYQVPLNVRLISRDR